MSFNIVLTICITIIILTIIVFAAFVIGLKYTRERRRQEQSNDIYQMYLERKMVMINDKHRRI